MRTKRWGVTQFSWSLGLGRGQISSELSVVTREGKRGGEGLPQAEQSMLATMANASIVLPETGPVLSPSLSQLPREAGPRITPSLHRGSRGSEGQGCEGQRQGGSARRLLPGNSSWGVEAGGKEKGPPRGFGNPGGKQSSGREETPPRSSPRKHPSALPCGLRYGRGLS